MRRPVLVAAPAALAVGLAALLIHARAQETAGVPAALPEHPGRFEFEVIESFDARYLGDTPGHVGKNGGLAATRPNAALGDPVFRDDEKIGKISGLTWDRGRGSLQVEFDPEPKARVQIGDVVWISVAPPAL